MYKTDNQREFDVRHRAPKPVLCKNLEGWIRGERVGGSGGRGHKYAAEAITILQKNYPPIEVINKLKIQLLKNRNFNSVVLSLD